MADSTSSMAPTEDCVITYPESGATAVVVTSGHITVYSDHPSAPAVLAVFNRWGEGGVSYANGRPWLVVTRNSWHVCDKAGRTLERGRFPRTSPQEVRCSPTEQLHVTFKDRQHITLTFLAGGASHTWQCGERLKRTESHLDKVVASHAGKLELDVNAIRARQAAIGSVYAPRGPHAVPTRHPGLGGLKQALAALPPSSSLQSTVTGLQACDARVQLIRTLPAPLHGTARMHQTQGATASGLVRAASAPDATVRSAGMATATSTRTFTTTTISSPGLADYGSPPMTATQRRWQRASAAARTPVAYTPRRVRLPHISMQALQTQVLGAEAARDTLYCVAVLADWQPGCSRLLPKLELGLGQLQADVAAVSSSPAGHIRVLRTDASESRWLQDKLNFRSVPMLLMWYQGHLVQATNAVSTETEFVAACTAALERGRRGDTLPDSWAFGTTDNALLDCIAPAMTLRG